MQESFKILGTATKDSVVKTVEHKYGNEAGQFVGDGMSLAENTYELQQALNPKSMLKKGGI